MPTMWANSFLGLPLLRDTALVKVLSILAGILPCQRCLQVFVQLARQSNARQLSSLNVTLGNVTFGEAFDLLAYTR
jgi:hypothetical protein